ncbi:SCO6881 family protein [Streptomyces sp. 8L]|uniref:SCO6881 family protein n=1 Tax=Streptomyces sp. 8L TaxID=2877242 RepID=UPI001CD69AC1|nr:ATP-binding protein [Streptomyces sp. 8L]MCA1224182.1 ATP-binding protein [Streptomyces sp. 8L]
MGFCDLPLADQLCTVGDAVDFASDPGKAIGDWLAKSAGELAATAADMAAKAVDTTTKVDLNATWFRDNYTTLMPLGLVLLVATFCAQLVRAAIRRDGRALAQAFTGTVAGVLFAFCAIALTTVAVEVVDALSDGLLATAHLNIASAVRRIVKVDELGALSPLGWLVPVIAGLGAAAGALLFWCVMMVRKVGILVMVTLAIFASAGGGWEVARRWRKGWIEATATLVVSKLLMTVIFVLGIAAMGDTQAKDGISALADVMTGIVIMVLVLLCPYAVFKFVHWAAEGTDGESIHRAGGAGAQIARAHAEKGVRKAASAVTTASTGGGAAGAGAATQGSDAAGGGFPGDIAANPTSAGGESMEGPQSGGSGLSPGGERVTSGLDKAVQPAPTSASDDTSSQVGGSPGPSGPGANAASGHGGGWQSTPPVTTAPPQGAPPSSGSHNTTSNGSAPPPPAGL